jgi:cell division cycle protein 20 (cofactor of APC complex)
LDAPGIADDYYLNLLDWSSSNVLAVGLGNSLYLWNATSGSVNELFSMGDDDLVSSVSWCQDGTHIAIGDNNGDTHLWDVESGARVRVIRDHPTRVGTLAWNREIMSSGGREGTIHNHDVRIASSRQAVLSGHEGDICGLKWSPDGTQLASGGNDNAVNIWDARTSAARYTKREHTAAVKVIFRGFIIN